MSLTYRNEDADETSFVTSYMESISLIDIKVDSLNFSEQEKRPIWVYHVDGCVNVSNVTAGLGLMPLLKYFEIENPVEIAYYLKQSPTSANYAWNTHKLLREFFLDKLELIVNKDPEGYIEDELAVNVHATGDLEKLISKLNNFYIAASKHQLQDKILDVFPEFSIL